MAGDWWSGRPAGSCATTRADRHRPDHRATTSQVRGCWPGRFRTCSTASTGRRSMPGSASFWRRASPASWRAGSRACRRCCRCSTSSRWRARPSASLGVVMATYFGLGSRLRAQLAAGPDHRAAADQPLAGAGAGRAARRPVQPAPRADQARCSRSAGATPARRRRSRRGRSATARRLERCPEHACRHQGITELRHDHATGGAPRGAQPDPGQRRRGFPRRRGRHHGGLTRSRIQLYEIATLRL